MISKCGYSQRNITIAALTLSVGLGFTQVPQIFDIFPLVIRTVFAENCVAVVFLVAIVLNLILPKNMEAIESPIGLFCFIYKFFKCFCRTI